MGAHSKPSRVKLPQAAGAAAVPALAGVAAAICLPATAASAATGPAATPGDGGSGTGTGATTTSVTTRTANPATVAHAAAPAVAKAQARELPAGFSKAASAHLLAARGTRHKAAAGTYTVRAGDSLSAIASRVYHNPAAWPVLYWGNHRKIRWADVITPGEVLTVPAKPSSIPAAPSSLGPSYAPKHAAATQAAPAAAAAQPVTTTATTVPAAGGWPGGAFGACVVMRESGGNPNIWNASGHWGLYQFSAATWAAYGGNPADFGSAGVAEQEAVFMNALARGGQGNWAPYDGC